VFTQKTSSRELREFYVNVIGKMILPDADYVSHLKFKLSALMRGPLDSEPVYVRK